MLDFKSAAKISKQTLRLQRQKRQMLVKPMDTTCLALSGCRSTYSLQVNLQPSVSLLTEGCLQRCLATALQAKEAAVKQDLEQANTKLRYSVFLFFLEVIRLTSSSGTGRDVISVRYTLWPITRQHECHPLKVIGDLFNCFVVPFREKERERESERERGRVHSIWHRLWLVKISAEVNLFT